MTTTPDFEAKAREIADKLVDASDEPWVVTISSALLRAFELGCQATSTAACEPSSSLRSSSIDSSGEIDLIAEISRLHAVLLERMKLKYAGDCKCGQCHLVPVDVIMNAANLIGYGLPREVVRAAHQALSSDEERSDEVSAANTSASLTPHQEEA